MKMNTVKKMSLGAMFVAIVLMQACAIVPASLPKADEVTPADPSGFDGIWMISGINKRLQLEGGRAVVVDPWIHWGAGIQQGMVALVNLRTTEDGGLEGVDLVNGGKTWRGSMNVNGNIDVAVDISEVPLKYQLIPIQLDYPEFVQQVTPGHSADSVSDYTVEPAQQITTQPVAQVHETDYAPDREEEGYSECSNLVVDPQTMQEVCLD